MPDLVMVHGLFGHLNVPEIQDAFVGLRISAPDLIGYGKHANVDTTGLTLQDQADHVITHIDANYDAPVHLLGHSIGGAVSALVTFNRPDIIASFTNVEGNFTLKDAFWTSQLCKKTDQEVSDIMAGYRADAAAWMNEIITEPTPLTTRVATDWLDHQPASTLKAQANAVVTATAHTDYLQNLRSIFHSDMPVHLIAGAHSAAEWDTPDWANQLCNSRFNIPKTGHLMMIEAPNAFAQAVQAGLNLHAGDR